MPPTLPADARPIHLGADNLVVGADKFGQREAMGVGFGGKRVHAPTLSSEQRALADELVALRERLGVSQAALGRVVGVESQYIYKLETGLTTIARVHVRWFVALRLALQRATPDEVWGPTSLSPAARCARIFAIAYPEGLPRPREEALH